MPPSISKHFYSEVGGRSACENREVYRNNAACQLRCRANLPALPAAVIFNGVIDDVEGSGRSLAFFVAGGDGGNVRRLYLSGHGNDYDLINTRQYYYSVATPQLIP